MEEAWQREIHNKNSLVWRKNLFQSCIALVILVTLMEIGGYYVYGRMDRINSSHSYYLNRYVLLPGTINWLSLLVTWGIEKSEKYSAVWKNRAVCTFLFIVCVSTECSHYVYPVLMCTPCIAIFMTVLFTDELYNRLLFCLSFLSMTLAVWWNYSDGNVDRFQAVTQLAVTAVITLVAYEGAHILERQEVEQYENIFKNYKLQHELMCELKIEPLTGLYNRKALMQSLEAKYRQYQRKKQGMHLVMLDIDDFKKINDTYGHVNGDEVLILISHILKENVRGQGSAYRYGGEEFILIFEKQDTLQVEDIAERIRQQVETLRCSFLPEDKNVTISIGIAPFYEKWKLKEWVEKSDEALYLAKKNGKNQVVLYEEKEDAVALAE